MYNSQRGTLTVILYNEFVIGQIFHILNRGIEKNVIFHTDRDYFRFVCGLHRFNNKNGALRLYGEPEDYFKSPPSQKRLVNIIKWSLLPNHYHLLVEGVEDGGAIEFTKRIGNGFTKYVNIKNKRSGYLFQNKAKIIPVEEDAHFLYLPFYIDANPIEIIYRKWKENGIENNDSEGAISFLKAYKWSSFGDYAGLSNFPDVINKDSFLKRYGTKEDDYLKYFSEWLVDNSQHGTLTVFD